MHYFNIIQRLTKFFQSLPAGATCCCITIGYSLWKFYSTCWKSRNTDCIMAWMLSLTYYNLMQCKFLSNRKWKWAVLITVAWLQRMPSMTSYRGLNTIWTCTSLWMRKQRTIYHSWRFTIQVSFMLDIWYETIIVAVNESDDKLSSGSFRNFLTKKSL